MSVIDLPWRKACREVDAALTEIRRISFLAGIRIELEASRSKRIEANLQSAELSVEHLRPCDSEPS